MTYKETVDFLFSQLPVYQVVGQSAYKADLHNIIALQKVLGNPENKFKSVHVAGTNGKGSVTHMLASVLQEAGYKTGIYCSPHLIDFRERIKVDGVMIPEEEVVSFVEKYTPLFKHIEPSFFEYTTALAFHFFAKEKVDIAIVEVGLGGRLDSTNIIVPELSVITNIGLDHTNILGDTLEKIAFEKAGIIKAGIPVVIGERQAATENVFRAVAVEKSAPLEYAQPVAMKSDLKGFYQKENIASAIAALRKLQQAGWKISDENIANGLMNVVRNTAFIGRWQTLAAHPTVVCDTGHNKEGIEQVVKQLKEEKCKKLHIVWGSVNDKDQSKILPLLPKHAVYYFCQPAIARALPVDELQQLASAFELKGAQYSSPVNAVKAALSAAGVEDFIFIGGSTFVVADVLAAAIFQ
ncbi:MAG: bifunctional folylpolyglutamate synthase/dihydrofolate synthase [Bacteroidetes bacterium]|nr:bifunctional folylpolyglutamate synthase/dihydrofolate synthase [Bacteroidota bacterium]